MYNSKKMMKKGPGIEIGGHVFQTFFNKQDHYLSNILKKSWNRFIGPFAEKGYRVEILPYSPGHNSAWNPSELYKFRKYFDWFIVLMIVFLFYIYLLSVSWNLGLEINFSKALPPALFVLFYYMGILVENAKRNWFIGIRTPWTLSSEKVWNKTHKLGGKLFRIAGVIILLGIMFPEYSFWFVLIPVIAFSIYVVIYSYFEYQKVKKK